MDDAADDTRANPVNVNTASPERLSSEIAGIGPTLAARIVAYRQSHGPFLCGNDLLAVSGIGPILLNRIEHRLAYTDEREVEGMEHQEATDLSEGPGMVDEQPSESMPDMPDEGAARQDASWREGPASEAVEPLLESSELDAASLPILEEEPIQPSPEPRLTDAPSPSAPASAVAIEAHAEPEAQAQPTRDAQPQPPRGAWRRSVGLVLLGGLFGVILTLLAALIWAGTVDFAPRRQVDALSRNVNTMYANQELAWQRLDELTLRADELERKTKRLEGLEARVGTLEGELQSAQQELVDSRQQVAQLSEALYALQEEQRQGMAQLDERLAKAEAEIGALSTSFQAISQQFDIVQARMRAFDGFFTGLRALLQEMNEDNQPNPGVLPLAPRSVTTPTPTPAKPATGG